MARRRARTRIVYRSAPKRRRRSYLGRVRRHFRNKTFPLAMAPAIGVPLSMMFAGDGQLKGIAKAWKENGANGQFDVFANETMNSISHQTIGYIPYNNQWDFQPVMRNIGLIVAGLVVHKLANKSGINGYFKRIPLVGKYLSV